MPAETNDCALLFNLRKDCRGSSMVWREYRTGQYWSGIRWEFSPRVETEPCADDRRHRSEFEIVSQHALAKCQEIHVANDIDFWWTTWREWHRAGIALRSRDFLSRRISSYKSTIDCKINGTTGSREIPSFVPCKWWVKSLDRRVSTCSLLDRPTSSPISLPFFSFRLLSISGLQNKIPTLNQNRRKDRPTPRQRTERDDRMIPGTSPVSLSLLPFLSTPHFSHEANNSIKITEFDEAFLQRYTTPGAPNMIILLLIADTPNDSCIGYFHRQISAIKEYVRCSRSFLITGDWKEIRRRRRR